MKDKQLKPTVVCSNADQKFDDTLSFEHQPNVKADVVTLFKRAAIESDTEQDTYSVVIQPYQSQEQSRAKGPKTSYTPLIENDMQNDQLFSEQSVKKTPKFINRPKHLQAKSIETSSRISRQFSNNSDLDFVLPQAAPGDLFPNNQDIDDVVRKMVDKVMSRSKLKVGLQQPDKENNTPETPIIQRQSKEHEDLQLKTVSSKNNTQIQRKPQSATRAARPKLFSPITNLQFKDSIAVVKTSGTPRRSATKHYAHVKPRVYDSGRSSTPREPLKLKDTTKLKEKLAKLQAKLESLQKVTTEKVEKPNYDNLADCLKFFSKKDKLVMIKGTSETYVLPLGKLIDICQRHAMICPRLDLNLKEEHLLREKLF